MTEEPNKDEAASPEKLLIDNLSDFRFHAAYMTYSNIYDKTVNPETKRQLNQNITALQQNQIDYATFYRNISQYRVEGGGFQHSYGKTFIRTQKKREWHTKMQKRERNKRHKR